MNHQLWTAVGGRVLALAFVLAGAAACGDDAAERTSRVTDGDTNTTVASNGDSGARNDVFAGARGEVSPSARVIGVEPAPAVTEGETNAPPKIDAKLNERQESTQRPVEGDNHSYSTVSPVTPQKAEGIDPQQLPSRKSQ